MLICLIQNVVFKFVFISPVHLSCVHNLHLSSLSVNCPCFNLLYMDNNDISTVSEHKHLGLVISDNGSLEKHIDMITEKAYKRINILRKFKFILDRKTLEKIYFTFVRPLLEYADVIWDNMSMSLNKKIENVQLEASRIVTGGRH